MAVIARTGAFNHAAEVFGMDQPIYTSIPRLKFQFSVEFSINDDVSMGDASFEKTFTFDRVANASLPDLDYNIQAMNQYNRIRYVPTRMSVSPVNISFYDTKDNQFQSILKAYSNHYFHGHELDTAQFSNYNLLNNGFASGDQHIFGAKSITNSARFMFDTIKIHNRDTAQGGRTFVLFNCMIQNINHDTLNYADSGPILYNVQFIPEHFNITNLQKELDEEKVSENTAIGGNLAGVVANRPDIIEPLPNNIETKGDAVQLQPFNGTLKAGEKLRNIDGKSFVVPAGG